MGILKWAIGIGVGIGILNKIRENSEEERRRVSTPCKFDNGITFEEFEYLAYKISVRFRRISQISVEEATVYCTVDSQSGISDWDFKVDYNDYGQITGRYWLSSDNSDSNIPDRFADLLSDAIHDFLEGELEVSEEDENISSDTTEKSETKQFKFCPFCGEKQPLKNPKFCIYCGNAFYGS